MLETGIFPCSTWEVTLQVCKLKVGISMRICTGKMDEEFKLYFYLDVNCISLSVSLSLSLSLCIYVCVCIIVGGARVWW